MNQKNDPIGQAILDFVQKGKTDDIIVSSDLCEDDVIETAYLFRTLKEMPVIEKLALKHCVGLVLDIGAGAGAHAKVLKSQGINVNALEPSAGAAEYIRSQNIPVIQDTIQQVKDVKFDTLLLMMNGLGLAGKLENLASFLTHLKGLLNPGGKIICDSTDIQYLYQEDDGSMWMDLNAEYYGNFKFQMKYKDHQTDWFDWLYVDFNRLCDVADEVGLSVELLHEEDDHYLVELKIK